jgi:proliferating cell nuclear antigen
MSHQGASPPANVSIPAKGDCDIFIKTLQGTVVRILFETLKDIIFETTLLVSPNGIKATSMDSSKSSLVYLKLDASNFEEYHAARANIPLGISMQSMFKLIKTISNHDILTIFVRRDVPHELGLAIENAEKRSKTIYSLKLLDTSAQDINVPEFSYHSVVTLPSVNFQRLCRDMQNIASTVVLESHPTKIVLSCSGDFASQTTVLGDGEEDEQDHATHDVRIQSDSTTVIRSMYSLKYLTLFGRSSALSNVVTLYIKEDHPLVMEFNAGSLGTLKFLLTPQLEDL